MLPHISSFKCAEQFSENNSCLNRNHESGPKEDVEYLKGRADWFRAQARKLYSSTGEDLSSNRALKLQTGRTC